MKRNLNKTNVKEKKKIVLPFYWNFSKNIQCWGSHMLQEIQITDTVHKKTVNALTFITDIKTNIIPQRYFLFSLLSDGNKCQINVNISS